MGARGIEVNTFTIAARDPQTGDFGICMATRSLAVGRICPYVRPHVGAVVTQATTDPRLGPLGIRLLELGYSAPKVLAELCASDDGIAHRQLAVIDMDGRVAAHTGARNHPWAGHQVGDGYVAMGNVLVGEQTVKGIAQGYEGSAGEPLAERLVRAIEGGRDAGGQHGGQRSAALLVTGDGLPFPEIDLRVDLHREPVGELRRIWEAYRPLIPYFRERLRNPDLPMAIDWLAARGLRYPEG